MRVIIVGVGGIGAMAAWQLAQDGHEVLAIEQFSLDHDLGSSYGDSRIVRRVYTDSLYTALMADAYPLWDALQAQFPEEELFRRAGGVFFGPAGHPQVRAAQQALEASRVDYEALDAAACARRFPAVVLQPEEIALYEPSMGYARASRCVCAAAILARKYGAQIREATSVADIQSGPGGQGVQVTTQAGETLSADRLLLTAGPWAGPLLERLGVSVPLVVTRQPYVHLMPDSHAADFEAGRFPVWIDAVVEAYGFPRMGEMPGVKVGLHRGGTATTPQTVDRVLNQEDYAGPRRYAARRFPWLSPQVAYAKVCLYTNTPDEDFIVDTVPGLPDAFVLGGCSGHGFKFTPLLGRIGANLAAGISMPYDLARFRLARFASNITVPTA